MKIAIIHPATKKQINLPDGSACPRVSEEVCLENNDIRTVVRVTHDLLCEIVWVYLSEHKV